MSPGRTGGDVDYYTSSTAKARLAIGTTGQVLTVAAGVPSWATASSGGMTLLSTTTLSGATTTISSISQSYNILYGVIYGVTNATANGDFRMAINGSTNSVTYAASGWDQNSASLNNTGIANNYFLFNGRTLQRDDANNIASFQINNYASSSTYKTVSSVFSCIVPTSQKAIYYVNGNYAANTAVSSLVFSNSGGNHSTGTVLLYGVK